MLTCSKDFVSERFAHRRQLQQLLRLRLAADTAGGLLHEDDLAIHQPLMCLDGQLLCRPSSSAVGQSVSCILQVLVVVFVELRLIKPQIPKHDKCVSS